MLVAPRAGNPDTWADNDLFPLLSLCRLRSVVDVVRTLEGLRPVFFGPCTPRRTWGTRPFPAVSGVLTHPLKPRSFSARLALVAAGRVKADPSATVGMTRGRAAGQV